MRIATYNVWNNDIDIRKEQLIDEINSIDVDIIGLQEISIGFWVYLKEKVKYDNKIYFACQDKDEGLAFLSKYKIKDTCFLNESIEYSNSLALNIVIEFNGFKISITNVHLPWDSVLAKEKQIVTIDQYIHKEKADFSIILGDFNCTEDSSVHHYLLGDQSLLGQESKPYWNDLANVHAYLNNYKIAPTLDFVNNPRWKGRNTNYIPDTCDRIYIMESNNWEYKFILKNVYTFGKNVSPSTGYAPSDHYGLLAEVDFSKSI